MTKLRKVVVGVLTAAALAGAAVPILLPRIRAWAKRTFVTHAPPRGHLWSPMGLAVDPEGTIFVADQRAGRISVFDPDRRFVTQFDHVEGYLNGDGEPSTVTRGLYLNAVGPGHLVFVAAHNLAEIVIEAGVPRLVRTIGRRGSDPGEMDGPEGSSVDTNGDVYATDEHNRRINVFDREGRYLRSLALPQDPQCVLVHGDRIYVSLNKRNYVCCYTKAGQELFRIGREAIFPAICWTMGVAAPLAFGAFALARRPRPGLWVSLGILAAGSLGCLGDFVYHHRPGQFRLPDHLCLSPDGRSMYVSDRWNHRVQVFDSDGTFRFTFGSPGTGPGQFWEPKQIAFDRQGRVLVVDRLNDRVQVFTPEGRWIAEFD